MLIKLTKKSLLVTVFCLLSQSAVTVNIAIAQLDRPTFFQEGDQLIQQEINRLQQETPPDPLTIKEGSLQWQKMIFTDGGFSVWIPQGVQSEKKVKLDTIAGDLDFSVFSSHSQAFVFIAAYADVEEPPNVSKEDILNSIRDSIVNKTKYTLTTESDISWEKYPGKELTLSDNNETITFRLFLLEEKVYVLGVSQKDNPNSFEQAKFSFFNSLELLQ